MNHTEVASAEDTRTPDNWEEKLKKCTLQDSWENGHHIQYWVDKNSYEIVANAYEIYKISHKEHFIRKKCRAELLLSLSPLFGKVLTNKEKSLKARFSKNTANKIASDKAITKSVVNGFTVENHFEAAENIRQIFEQAEFIGTFPDSAGDPNIISIHRFQKAIELSNGKNCIAYLTLKEVKKEGNRIYTQELLLNKYPPHEAGELTSRGLKPSEPIAYKCNPRTKYTIPQDS